MGVGVPASTRWWRSRQMVLLAPQVGEWKRNAGWGWRQQPGGGGRPGKGGGGASGRETDFLSWGQLPGSCRGHLAARGSAGHPRPAPRLQRRWGQREEGSQVEGGKANLRLIIKIQHFKSTPGSAPRITGESFSRSSGSPFVCKCI